MQIKKYDQLMNIVKKSMLNTGFFVDVFTVF